MTVTSNEVERPDWFLIIARRKLAAPENWQWWKVEAVDHTRKSDDAIVTGDVPVSFITRGKNKGRPVFKGLGQRVVVTGDDVRAEKAAYELRTGKCSVCYGTGQRMNGWSAADGYRHRDCERCSTTGAARSQQENPEPPR